MVSPDSPQNLGAIGNVLTGYGQAWRHWPQMVAVLAPILLPVMLVRLALRLLAAEEDAVIVNGVVLLLPREGPLAWVEAGVSVVGWMWAVGAGILVMAGVLRGVTVRPGVAVLKALYRTPELGLALVLLGLVAFAALSAAAQLGPFAVVAVLLVGGVIAARTMLVVPNIMLRGHMYGSWRHAQGRVVTIAGMVVLGVFAIPFGILWLTDQMSNVAASGAVPGEWTSAVLTVLAQTLGAVGVMAFVAGQAGTFAMAYLVRRDGIDDSPEAVEERLTGMAGDPVRSRRWSWAYAASPTLPALLTAGVALTNPYSAPAIRSTSTHDLGGVLAVGWPQGGHPVIVTGGGIHFCQDDQCADYLYQATRSGVHEGWGMAAVGADGSVVEANVTGSENIGGPFVHLTRCTPDECHYSWVPVRASSDEEFGWAQAGVGAAPDGTVYIAVAYGTRWESSEVPSKVELKLIRCDDATCSEPQRHSFGIVEGRVEEDPFDQRRASPPVQVGFDAAGWPVASYHTGWQVWRATCSPSTCDGKRLVAHQSSAKQFVALDGVEAGIVTLGGLQLWHCRGELCADTVLEGCCVDERMSALALGDSGPLALFAVPGPPPDGVHIRFGPPETERKLLVLWHCADAGCERPRRIPLNVVDGQLRGLWLAERDGRVLIVANDWRASKIVSLTL